VPGLSREVEQRLPIVRAGWEEVLRGLGCDEHVSGAVRGRGETAQPWGVGGVVLEGVGSAGSVTRVGKLVMAFSLLDVCLSVALV
jgi:hypothetical protein